jgi:hypothetical protein
VGIARPFRRTCRAFSNGSYSEGGRWGYVVHPAYAVDPPHYIRAQQVIQKDFINLLEYIEPADANLSAFSIRVHELLLRSAAEVEGNLKAILKENGYTKAGDLTMTDYRKVEVSHRPASNANGILIRNFVLFGRGALAIR